MGSRGVKKPKLRDLSQHKLTPEEAKALQRAINVNSPPIVTAIAGAVFVENELEICIRSRLARKDEETWLELIEERGPLDTFSRKIIAGYALGLYDTTFRANLDIVRSIRNAFAHSKRLIDFDHALIAKETGKIAVPSIGRRNFKFLKTNYQPKEIYPALCLTLGIELIKISARSSKAKLKRLENKLGISPLVRALGSKFSPQSYKNFQQAHPGLRLPLSQQNHISGPNALAQASQRAGMLQGPDTGSRKK